MQLIPARLLVTVPLPAPVVLTVRATSGAVLNVAVQVCAAVIDTEVEGNVPLQAPLQPANTEPGSACASSVTTVPVE